MQFCTSSQAKSWMFSAESLAECKRRASSFDLKKKDGRKTTINQVRKFASGFHKRQEFKNSANSTVPQTLSIHEQDLMIQFHAHQIQFLIGPNAILYDLRVHEKVLITAIVFFRRFYLSNSIIEISPRKIAAASAFFAAKVEEEKVEIGLIAHATALVQQRVHNAPLCCKELRAVSVMEIEFAERLLMEGLNYEFHCHHATDFFDEIFNYNFARISLRKSNERNDRVDISPRSTATWSGCDNSMYGEVDFDFSERRRQKALDVAQRAYIFTDIPFLYAPCDIALAVVAIASGSVCRDSYCIGSTLLHQYMDMSLETFRTERSTVVSAVSEAILNLFNCKAMDLCLADDNFSDHTIKNRAEELRHVMGEVATLRLLRKMNNLRPHTETRKNAATKTMPLGNRDDFMRNQNRRCTDRVENNTIQCRPSKRTRTLFEIDFTPPRLIRTCAKITPTATSTSYFISLQQK